MSLDETLLAQLSPEQTVDIDGKPTPLRDTPFVREAKDFPTFVKTAYDAHREVGARIPVKVAPEGVQEWRKTHLPTLYKNGLLEAPPASPADYGIVKPEGVPDGLQWDDERATKYAGILHKYGVPKAIVPELMALHVEALTGAGVALKTSVEEGMAALKAEHGDKFDERVELVKRLTSNIFKTPEELEFFERTGLANHPGFLSVLLRLAPLAAQDSSVVAGMSGSGSGAATAEAVRTEVSDIMSNPNNPKNKLYWQQDRATMEYVNELYKKAYGDAKVEIR